MTSPTERMKCHLISQFDKKPNIAALLEAIGTELFLLQTTFSDLKNKRWIDTGEGVQLDRIGEIIDKPRTINEAIQLSFFGFKDQENAGTFGQYPFFDEYNQYLASTTLRDIEYRRVLWQKVSKDVSRGTVEDTIHSLQFIYNAEHVIVEDVDDAKIRIAIGRNLTLSERRFARALGLTVKAGGIGVKNSLCYDHDAYFGFADQQNAKGFEVGKMADLF